MARRPDPSVNHPQACFKGIGCAGIQGVALLGRVVSSSSWGLSMCMYVWASALGAKLLNSPRVYLRVQYAQFQLDFQSGRIQNRTDCFECGLYASDLHHLVSTSGRFIKIRCSIAVANELRTKVRSGATV